MEQEEFKFKLRGKTLVIVDWANVYGWFKDLGWEIKPKKFFNYISSYSGIINKRFYFGIEEGNKKSENFNNEISKIGFEVCSKFVKWVPVSLEKSYFKNLIRELFNVLDNIKNTNSAISGKLYELREKVEGRLADIDPDFDSDGNVSGTNPSYAPKDEKIYNSVYSLIEELDLELRKLNLNIEELQKNLSAPILRRKCDFDCEIVMDVMLKLNEFDGVILFSGDGDYKAIIEYLLNQKKQAIVVHPFGKRGKEFNELLDREMGGRPYFCPVEKLKEFLV